MNLSQKPLAMAYVPWQCFENVLDAECALKQGTVFEDLIFPFTGCHSACQSMKPKPRMDTENCAAPKKCGCNENMEQKKCDCIYTAPKKCGCGQNMVQNKCDCKCNQPKKSDCFCSGKFQTSRGCDHPCSPCGKRGGCL